MDNKRNNDGFNAGCVEEGVRSSIYGNEVLFYYIRRSICGSSCRRVGTQGKNDHVDVGSGDYLLLLHNSGSSISSRLCYIIFLFPVLRWLCFALLPHLCGWIAPASLAITPAQLSEPVESLSVSSANVSTFTPHTTIILNNKSIFLPLLLHNNFQANLMNYVPADHPPPHHYHTHTSFELSGKVRSFFHEEQGSRFKMR